MRRGEGRDSAADRADVAGVSSDGGSQMQVTDRSRIVRAQGDSETSLWSGLGILAGAALLGGAAWDWFSGSAAKRKEAKERESAQVPVVPLLNVDEQISATMDSSDTT